MDGFVADEVNRRHTYNGIPVPSVTQIIDICKDFSKIKLEDLRIAQEWGSAVHEYLQLYDAGELNLETADSRVIPILESWEKMKAERGWIKPILSEKRYYSKRYRYTGRLDCVFKEADRYVLIDFKTGDDSFTDLQTAANLNLVRENYAMIRADRMMIHFDIDGKIRPETYPMSKFRSDFNEFLCLAKTYQIKNRKKHL